MIRAPRRALLLASLVALAMTIPGTVSANHSWGGYHWARTSNPFTLNVGDNVGSAWDSYLNTALSDWSKSTVLDLNKVAGTANPKNCKATTGMVQVCDSKYGYNGWLGVAGISITGGVHITKAYVKLNDSYYSSPTYDTPAWRAIVTCQEIGHTFGLDHQDENFDNANLGTCMDYTSDPSSNQHPNQGDYDELLCIYDPASAGDTLTTSTHSCTGTGHLDSTTTVGASTRGGSAGAVANGRAADAAWGTFVKSTDGGHGAWFMRDFGNGNLELTHVFWAD
jgi:hypothetical protein